MIEGELRFERYSKREGKKTAQYDMKELDFFVIIISKPRQLTKEKKFIASVWNLCFLF